ncbi:MAG: phosphonate ABC transporter, permease protein PhnE [Syntrophobacterales bacterium]|nr:phosphonate ABC transporter, permease protein PhnE [Syntrophobacterales bacterium]
MSIEDLKRRISPFTPFNLFIVGCFILIGFWSWKGTDMKISDLIKGWHNMIVYIAGNPQIPDSGFLPPNITKRNIFQYLGAMVETVQMAFLALVISVIIAFPLSFLAAMNTVELLIPGNGVFQKAIRSCLYWTVRIIANFARSINEMVWALIFVSAVGLGPMPGILALGVHTSGVLTKLLAEGIENIQPGPITALSSTGAGFLKVIRFAVIPQIMPFFVSMTLYRFESDVRSATILGLTGAGGIGMYLYDNLRGYNNKDVTTILIIIVITVALIDKLCALIRARYT